MFATFAGANRGVVAAAFRKLRGDPQRCRSQAGVGTWQSLIDWHRQ